MPSKRSRRYELGLLVQFFNEYHKVSLQMLKLELVKHKMGMSMIFNELDAMKRVCHPAAINLHFAFQDK